jgi:hypothetical protein
MVCSDLLEEDTLIPTRRIIRGNKTLAVGIEEAAQTPCIHSEGPENQLSSLPPSMRRHFLDSLSRNSEAFKKLSTM